MFISLSIYIDIYYNSNIYLKSFIDMNKWNIIQFLENQCILNNLQTVYAIDRLTFYNWCTLKKKKKLYSDRHQIRYFLIYCICLIYFPWNNLLIFVFCVCIWLQVIFGIAFIDLNYNKRMIKLQNSITKAIYYVNSKVTCKAP